MPFRKLHRSPKKSPPAYASPGTLLYYVEPFCEWQRVRDFSESHVEKRGKYLRHFILFCEERGLGKPEEVTRQVVDRYQRHLYHRIGERTGKPFSVRMQLQHLWAVRAFFKWLTRERVLLYNPTAEMELPRLGKRLPRHVLSAKEAECVLGAPDVESPLGLRDRSLLEVLYSTGIRRMECVNLKVYDVDLPNRTVFVHQGKGKKDRMIPIGERAALWLAKYLHDVRPRLVSEPDSQYLFLTPAGESFAPEYLTELVRRYVVLSGIGKDGACHLFRHTMATLMLEGGADVRYVQAMLGHNQLSTTEIYTHVSIRKLKEVHERTHPAKVHRAEAHGTEVKPLETEEPSSP